MNLFTLVALLLMVLAVAGSFTPVLPGALLSIAGILVYWWSTGYTSPGTFFLAAFILTGLTAALVDYFGGALAARAGGASSRTSLAAGMVGLLLFFVAGPVGILVGIAGTVFLREYMRTGEREKSLRAAAYSTAGVLGSAVVQFMVTVSLLLAFMIALIV